MNDYQLILLATDFGPLSKHVARRAKQIAENHKAKLHVLHVVEEVVLYGEDVDMMLGDPIINNEKMFELAQERMKELADSIGFADDVECEVVWGSPKSTIISWAQEHNIDLIIVGSHGQHGLERFLGSVSNSISHQVSCDVLIVRE